MSQNETVIEIGPGKGSLTKYLLKENPESLTAIEKDEKLKPFLEKIKLKNSSNFNFIIDDALHLDLSTLTKKK